MWIVFVNIEYMYFNFSLCVQLFKEDNDDWCCFATLKGHQSTVWGLAWDKTGSRIASCSADKTVKIWQEYEPGMGDFDFIFCYTKLKF
jgi:WD40 repeat protein